MNPAILIALLPLIEAILREAPALVDDVKKIIAAVEGKPTTPGPDIADKMADADAELLKHQ